MSLPQSFDLGGKPIGPGHPTYVIAEAGANHNRDMGIARELIDVAADAGADAIKFQTYSGATIYSRKTPKFKYLEGVTDKAPTDLLEDISLPRDWQAPLAEYARAAGSSSCPRRSTTPPSQELDALDVPALKIASFELVDLPLIRIAAATGRPLILSTGMAVIGEIEEAIRRRRGRGRARGRR